MRRASAFRSETRRSRTVRFRGRSLTVNGRPEFGRSGVGLAPKRTVRARLRNYRVRPTAVVRRRESLTSETQNIPWGRISAEGAAIVVSILLAFTIDAWYDRFVERRTAAGYEQRLLVELEGVRTDLELLVRTLHRAIAYSEEAAPFFSGEGDQISGDRLVLALVNVGREYADPFDVSTYQDLLSSGRLGSIEDDKRRAIQRAYELVPRVEMARYPYQEEYNLMVRAWIPTTLVVEITEACSNIA